MEWAPILGHHMYEINRLGDVRLARSGRRRTPQVGNQYGHLSVVLPSDSGSPRKRYIHHLVLETFVSTREPGMRALHRNGDPLDNRVENLYWGLNSDNQRDAVAHGNHAMANRTHCPHGHDYTVDNTYIQPSNGARHCRTCAASRKAAWAAANRGSQLAHNTEGVAA